MICSRGICRQVSCKQKATVTSLLAGTSPLRNSRISNGHPLSKHGHMNGQLLDICSSCHSFQEKLKTFAEPSA